MSLVNDFWKWIQDKMIGTGEVTVTDSQLQAFIQQHKAPSLEETEFLLEAGIRMIAGAIANCRFQTFKNDTEIRKEEYYLWNYEPNNNQNSAEFIHKMVWMIVHNGECLIVEDKSGKLHIADKYCRHEYALYQDIFTDVTLDIAPGSQGAPYTFSKSFRAPEVIFLKLHNRSLTALMSDIGAAYADLIKTAYKAFAAGSGEHGILSVNAQAPQRSYGTKADGTPRTFNDVYNDMMTKQFKSYFENTNAVMTLFDGFEYKPSQTNADKASDAFTSIEKISDRTASRVANALGIPPVLLKGEVANDGTAVDTMLTFAVMPYVRLMEAEINRKKYGNKVTKGTYLHIDTSRIKYIDPFSIATGAYNLVGMGYSTDEIRYKLGDPPTGEEWSKVHKLSKNFDDPGGDNTRISEQS